MPKSKPAEEHPKVPCVVADSWYHGSTVRRGGAWKDLYRCPTCGREGKFLANYIGQRKVMCDGQKFTKEPK